MAKIANVESRVDFWHENSNTEFLRLEDAASIFVLNRMGVLIIECEF